MSRARRVAVIVGGLVVLGYLALCTAACGLQRTLVFPAPLVAREPKGLVVRVEGGTPMLWSPPAESQPVVVHFHGNGEQLADEEWLAQLFTSHGIGFAAVEYPGYGLAKGAGEPTEESIAKAATLALQHLTGPLGVAKERLVLEGQSIGTGVAVRLAAEGWGRRLVLISPYTSLPDVGARALPFLPVRLLMQYRFDSASRAPGITIPVLIVHGTSDEVIPFDLGESLARKFPDARFFAAPGGHHNDIWSQATVQSRVLDFVRE